eukprot:550954-Hanusia_phi.AAC.1
MATVNLQASVACRCLQPCQPSSSRSRSPSSTSSSSLASDIGGLVLEGGGGIRDSDLSIPGGRCQSKDRPSSRAEDERKGYKNDETPSSMLRLTSSSVTAPCPAAWISFLSHKHKTPLAPTGWSSSPSDPLTSSVSASPRAASSCKH